MQIGQDVIIKLERCIIIQNGKWYSCLNQMWIVKNSKQLLENLQSQSSHINNIRTFDFSTLYTTIPHDKLKSRLSNKSQAFRFKNGKKTVRIYCSTSHLDIKILSNLHYMGSPLG